MSEGPLFWGLQGHIQILKVDVDTVRFQKVQFCIQGCLECLWTLSATKQCSNSSHRLKIRLWIYFPVFKEGPVMIDQRYKPFLLCKHHTVKVKLSLNKTESLYWGQRHNPCLRGVALDGRIKRVENQLVPDVGVASWWAGRVLTCVKKALRV